MVQVILLLLAVCISTANSYNLVAAPRGTCTQKLAYASFKMIRSQCGTMGGAWNGSPSWSQWINCHIDWCKIPSSGRVASGSVWGIDQKQGSTRTSSSRTYGIIKMIRSDCDKIGGRYNSNPISAEWTDCHLYFIKKDGSNRWNIDMLVLSSVGKCSSKVARGIVRTQQRICSLIGGEWNRNPGAYDWTDCHMDICLSPVIQCKPSDSWQTITTCRNPSSHPMSCSFQLTTGIEKGSSSSSSTGGSSSQTASITAEVGFELEGLFSMKFGTTISSTTGFNWSSTRGSHSIWRKETSITVSTELRPKSAVSIVQVVGSCGDFRVATPEYAVCDVQRG